METLFRDVVSTPELFMGVKAVWGRSKEPIMCFGTRGADKSDSKRYYSQARRTSERALTQPYFLTVGGGDRVPDDMDGRAVELVRATGAYGDTSAMVIDDDLRSQLEQWPVSVMLSEVYSIKGEPRLVEDLGMPDRRVLTNAFDTVRRDDERIVELWERLANWPVERRHDVVTPPGFREPQTLRLVGTFYPTVVSASKEGKQIWKLSVELERRPELRRAAKENNRARNNGRLVCEACGFNDEMSVMFDAHHLNPLAAGIRETHVSDLAILCPTCHRWAHAKGTDKLSPLSILELKTALTRLAR